MPNSITYPLDGTGINPANLVVDEIHTLTEINSNTYNIIIPKFAPFYLDNFILKHVDMNGIETVLTEDVDYYNCLPFIGGTRSVGKMLYGGISFNNAFVNGIIKVTYQSLGDKWVANSEYVLTRLAELVYNPRTTVWDVLTNVQEVFPPLPHDQKLDYVYGFQYLVDSINALASQIASSPSQSSSLLNHILDITNPHSVNKTQVGLGNVPNFMLATDNEVNAENQLDKFISLRQVLLLLSKFQRK